MLMEPMLTVVPPGRFRCTEVADGSDVMYLVAGGLKKAAGNLKGEGEKNHPR